MDIIKKNIKNVRKQKKYSQAHIANKLGITTRAYSKIENGATSLTIERLNKITNILGINLTYLFDGNPVANNNTNTTSSEAVLSDTVSTSLIKHYQETINLLKKHTELLNKLVNTER